MYDLTKFESDIVRLLEDPYCISSSVEDIAWHLGRSNSATLKTLRGLRRKGSVAIAGGGWYSSKPSWRYQWPLVKQAGRILQACEDSQRLSWSIWPLGCCFVSCLTLVPLLRASLEWDLVIVVGWVAGKPHAWLESPEGDVIDPTYGQFDGGPAVRILPTCRSAELGHVSVLYLARRQEDFYRSSIRTRSLDSSGWDQACRIHELFSDNPVAYDTAH